MLLELSFTFDASIFFPPGGLGDTPLFPLPGRFGGLYEGSFNLPEVASFLLFLELVSPEPFDGVDLWLPDGVEDNFGVVSLLLLLLDLERDLLLEADLVFF